jgi:hypothetical protein
VAYRPTTKKKPTSSKKKAISKGIADALHQQLTDTITQLVTGDGWSNLLLSLTQKTGTEISRYSFSNMLLIWTQYPEATAVCSFNAWLARGRVVLKGSKSLRINSPMPVKDTDTNGTVRKDGNGQDKTHVLFRMIPVFDVEQTEPIWQDGHKPMTITPTVGHRPIAKLVTGDAPAKMWEQLAEQVAQQGYTVVRGTIEEGVNGRTIPVTKTVIVKDTLPEAHACKTLAHELGHILLGHTDDVPEYQKHKGRFETEAESFAYMVASWYGLDSAAYSAPYISTWAGEDPSEVLKVVQATGNRVLKAFRAFLAAVESPEVEQTVERIQDQLLGV